MKNYKFTITYHDGSIEKKEAKASSKDEIINRFHDAAVKKITFRWF